MFRRGYYLLSFITFSLLSSSVVAEYTKVARDGSAIGRTAQLGTAPKSWACTYDSSSKLLWEIKTEDRSLRDRNWSYSWYSDDAKIHLGNPGTANSGNCVDQVNCDTQKFVQQVNREGLCGANDWRLPTLAELQSLIKPAALPAIDNYFFPDLTSSFSGIQGFWTSSTVTTSNKLASYVHFEKGTSLDDPKNLLHKIRLVRNTNNFNPTISTSSTPAANIPYAWFDQFNNDNRGIASNNISYVKTPTGLGALFLQAQQSRIEYAADDIPSAGTVEFLVNINSAYRIGNSNDELCAGLLLTNRVRFMVCKNGAIALGLWPLNTRAMQIITAPATKFRFGQWHLVSFSYNANGTKAIALNGQTLENLNTSTNNDMLLVKHATLGDTVGLLNGKEVQVGFQGVIDAIRFSPVENDWLLGKDRPKLTLKLAAGSFKKPNRTAAQAIAVLVNDARQRHVFGKLTDDNWFEFFARKNRRYSIEIPNDSVGSSLNPGLEIFNAEGTLLRSLVNDGVSGEGEQIIWTAPATGLMHVRVSNQAPLGRNSNLDNMFDLQIFDTDAPQQSLVKGNVLNACTQFGINKAEVAGLLGTGISDSTLTHKSGEFGLLLNPDNYQITSYATNFIDTSQTVAVKQTDDLELKLNQAPISSCANYSPPPLDPVLLQQQAVAVFDPGDNILIVRDVLIDDKVYYAELQHLGDFRFALYRLVEISSALHNSPATYDHNTLISELPSLFVINKAYRVRLQNDGTGVFTLLSVEDR